MSVVIGEYRRSSLSLLLMALMVMTSFVVLASAPARADASSADEVVPDYGFFDGAAVTDPTEKIDADLADKIVKSEGPFKVTVFVSDRSAVNPVLEEQGLPLVGGVELNGLPSVREMTLDSDQIMELAKNPGIYKILTYYPPEYDRPEVDPELEIPDFKAAPPEPEDYDVDIVHGAEEAWMMGYDGTDVTVAVIDTGFDMAHPDLLGQQARYNSGPYDGWPISYDDAAAMAWGNGEVGGWVADTSAWTWDDGWGFAYFDGAYFYIDGLTDVWGNPVTSQSGDYHIGWHTDANLANLWGMYVGVLVVDSVSPYVYDTVYVDIDCDFDFTDEKACMMGDETSYYDFYDTWSMTEDWSSWDAGDGYPDLSGGMIYWISDGAYALPGSIYYGDWWVPGSGEAVAFVGEFFLGESHGTMTSSAALGTGASMWGMLTGMAPGAKLITIPMTGGVIYPWLFAEWGADATPGTGDEANIVSNSYGWSDTAIWAGYDVYDMYAGYISRFMGGNSLWVWSTGNGGPGYGTAHSVTDFSSVHVGAGTTMQYRYWLGYEQDYDNTKWGDVVPFSNSGPGRNGKLNAEIIASGAYSLEPMPLNNWDAFGSIGDGYVHFQIGSGTSHATPTVAGGAALGYSAYYYWYGGYPDYDYAKAALMATADDMHFDPFKQGAGWLNAGSFTKVMGAMYDGYGMAESLLFSGWNEPQITKAALYPGYVYGTRYETYPNFMLPGDVDDTHIVETINYDMSNPLDFNVTSKILLKTGSDLIEFQTVDAGDNFLDVTAYVPASTDLLKVTMFMPFEQFDPEMDYESNVEYWLELHDWLDLDLDGVMNTSSLNWELSRYTVDGENCNYNQVMIKDPMDRTNDGLIVRVRPYVGAAGVNMSVQLDYYELQTFPWITFRPLGGPVWTTGLDVSLPSWSLTDWEVRVEVPLDAPVGTYGAAIYVDYGYRVQCIPVVINVPAATYEFEFGGPSYFDTPYNNDFSGLADKGWRFEVGDWRMYWCMPSDWISYNAQLVTTVEWSELPTDVNVHMLASVWAGWDQFWEPLAPDMAMEPIAMSDEDYMGSGTFGIGTNTGEAREVLTADLGPYIDNTGPAPFAILTRCPVMAGHSAQDTLYGFTTLIELNGYSPTDVWLDAPQPGDVPLTGVVEGGWYDITVTDAVEVRGGGDGPYEMFDYGTQPIYPDTLTGDFVADLANAGFTMAIWVEDSHNLIVSVEEAWDCPDIDLGLWYDEDMDYVADLTEPYWYVGASGSYETLELPSPEDGQYLIKVLGYEVWGWPGYFYLTTLVGVPGYIEVTDLEALAGSGTHEFNISYSVPERVGVFVGWATLGFMGADDSISIPFVIVVTDVGAPSIDNLYPVDGSAIPTTDLVVSFYVNDHTNFYSGWASWDFYVYLDGMWDMQSYASVDDANVTIVWHYPLTQGSHYLDIWARDIYWNWVYEYVEFSVNSLIEEFWAEFADPGTGDVIPDSSTVSLTEVSVRGYTDPYSDVWITTEWDSYYVESDTDGYFEESTVALQEGLNIVTVETVNDAGVEDSTVKMIESDTYCRLWVEDVESPTATGTVDITGWTDEDAALLIGGTPVPVNMDGTFSGTFALSEGDNTFLVEATDGVGNTASAEVTVVLDTTAPVVVISSPDDMDVVAEAAVTVSGTVDDASAMVWVNGVAAEDGAGGFSAVVALSEGDNTVTVVAVDELGNAASESIVVTYDPPVYVTPDELQDLIDVLQDQIDDLVTEDDTIQGQIDALQEDLDALQADLDAQVGDLNESMLDEIAGLQEQIDALEDQIQQDVDDVNTRVDDTDAFADMLMYLSIGLFLVAIVLLVVVWFMLSRKKGGSEPVPPPEE